MVAVTGFRAAESAGGVRFEQMAMTAHPAGLAARHALDQGIVGHVLGDDGAGGNETVAPEGDPAYNRRVGPDRGSAADQGLLVKALPADLRARVGDVGQHAGGAEENVILDHRARVDRHVVLRLHVASDGDAVGNEGVLPENAFIADYCSGADVGEVPDFCAGPNCGAGVDHGGRVGKIIGGAHGCSAEVRCFAVTLEAGLGCVQHA